MGQAGRAGRAEGAREAGVPSIYGEYQACKGAACMLGQTLTLAGCFLFIFSTCFTCPAITVV